MLFWKLLGIYQKLTPSTRATHTQRCPCFGLLGQTVTARCPPARKTWQDKGKGGQNVTTYQTPLEKGRAQFGSLSAQHLTPQEKALEAIGEAIPALEAALGCPLSVQAQVREGFIWAEVYMPDEYYNAASRQAIRAALREAAQVFGVNVFAEIDSKLEGYEQ